MVDYPNIFALGQQAFDQSYKRANTMRQDRANVQAGQSIAGGDYVGGANALNQAGMLDQAHNVLADQQVLEDRKTAAGNLEEDRATKAAAVQVEGLYRLTEALKRVPEGQRLPWLQSKMPLLQSLHLPVDKFASADEASLSNAGLAPWEDALGKERSKLHFVTQGPNTLAIDDRTGDVKNTYKGPLIVKKDETIYAPDDPAAPASAGPGSMPTQQPAVPALASLSPQDRDAAARMMVTEAGGEGTQGMAAVAHVALNRLKSGYGGAKSLSDVVNAPNQFEGMNRAAGVRPADLQRANAVLDQVLSGQMPDPTNGADHYLNPVLQTQLGRQQPAWANGSGQRIGNHVFYGGGNPQKMAAQGANTLEGGAGSDTPQAPAGYHLMAQGPTDPEDVPMGADAVKMGATEMAMTGKLPPLGMGKAARNDRKAMMEQAASLIKEWNITPEDWVTGVAKFKVTQGSLSKVSQTKNMVEASENAVVANMNQVVKPLMAKVQPGGVPFLNKYVLAVRDRAFGDPDVKAYDNALHTVADEYAKVMTTTSGAGGQSSSDSARQEAYRRLSTSGTPQQILATFQALQSEMANRKAALAQQESALQGQLRYGLAPQPPGAPQAAPAAAPGTRPPLTSFERR